MEKLEKNTKTIYVSNFPEDWAIGDVKDFLGKFGTVVDCFMPSKRNMDGLRFVFAKYDRRAQVQEILKVLKGFWIGSFKVLANLALFDRSTNKATMPSLNRNVIRKGSQVEDGVSFLQVTSSRDKKELVKEGEHEKSVTEMKETNSLVGK